MIVLKCIQRIRNEYNEIIGYILQDEKGTVQTVYPDLVKENIKYGKWNVVNLKLSDNNKLLFKKEEKPKYCYIDTTILREIYKIMDFSVIKNLYFKSFIDTKKQLAKYKLMNIPIKQYKYYEKDLLFIETNKTIELLSEKQIKFRDSNVRPNMGLCSIGHFADVVFNTIDLSQVDTSEMTDMKFMFNKCSVKYLNLKGFNTSNVTNMAYMFSQSCHFTTILNLETFDTSKVEDMAGMFMYCQTQEPLDLSRFNTSKVIDMYGMFCQCKSKAINIKNFDYRSVLNKEDMFDGFKGTIIQ